MMPPRRPVAQAEPHSLDTKANEHRIAPSVHVAASSRDGHQACQNAIALAMSKSLGSGLRGQKLPFKSQARPSNA